MMKIRFKKVSGMKIGDIFVEISAREYNQQVQKLEVKLQEPNDINIKVDGRVVKILLKELESVEVLGDYLKLHPQDLLFRGTLSQFLTKLPLSFTQVSRSTAINLNFLQKVEPALSGNKIAKLYSGQTVSISRRYWKDVRERILQ